MPLSTTAVKDRHAYRTGIASGQLPEFIRNDQLPPDAPEPWTTMMMEACHKLHPKPKSITKLKEAFHVIWNSLPPEPINKAVKSFRL